MKLYDASRVSSYVNALRPNEPGYQTRSFAMINSLLRVITYALFPFALCACGVIPGSFPSEFPAVSVPSDNPGTEAGIALGKKLFFDPILSSNGEVSCASCSYCPIQPF